MAVQRVLACLVATALLIPLAMSANITVGGANGWDISTDVETWVASQKFQEGDNLVFQYTPSHDVLEVSKADYDSCQTSNPIQTYNDGNTVIPLTSTGKRYFICGSSGHCIQGMKIEVDTLQSSTPAATSPSTSPAATSPSTSPPAPSPSTSPSASPAPETSPSAGQTPESAPESALSPDVPSAESPETSPSPSGLSPLSPPSSANRISFRTCLTLSFGLVLMVLLAL